MFREHDCGIYILFGGGKWQLYLAFVAQQTSERLFMPVDRHRNLKNVDVPLLQS